MVEVRLYGAHLVSARMIVDIPDNQDIHVKGSFEFSVNYENEGEGTVRLKKILKDEENPDAFLVEVTYVGQLSFTAIQSDDDKRDVHMQAYKLIFPYAQNTISSLIISAGIQPFYMEPAKMNKDDIELNQTK